MPGLEVCGGRVGSDAGGSDLEQGGQSVEGSGADKYKESWAEGDELVSSGEAAASTSQHRAGSCYGSAGLNDMSGELVREAGCGAQPPPPFVDAATSAVNANASTATMLATWAQPAPPAWNPTAACGTVFAAAAAPGVGYLRARALVQLRGAAACRTDGGCVGPGLLLLLPPEMRPLQALTFAIAGSGGAYAAAEGGGVVRVDVLPDGRVLFAGAVADPAALSAAAAAAAAVNASTPIGFADAARCATVRIRSDIVEPAYGWSGSAACAASWGAPDCAADDGCCEALWSLTLGSIGRVARIDSAAAVTQAANASVATGATATAATGGDVWVDFPAGRRWRAAANELERAAPTPWVAVDGVAVPVPVPYPGLAVRITAAVPAYGWEQDPSRGAPGPGDVGIVTDVGPMPALALRGYAGGAAAVATGGAGLGPEDVLIDFPTHPFWRGGWRDLVACRRSVPLAEQPRAGALLRPLGVMVLPRWSGPG